MNTTETIIHISTILIGVCGIGFWVAWARYNNHRWRYAVAPVIWMAHFIVYFITRLANPAWLNAPTITFWELVVILHGAINISVGGMVMWNVTKAKKKVENQLHRMFDQD